jgi:hypothetical protein
LVAALNSAVTKSSKSVKSSKTKGGRRKKGSGSESVNDLSSPLSRSHTASSQASGGGVWSTIDSLLGPLGLVVGIMALTILILLWRGSGRSSRGYDLAGVPNRVKLAAYEEMWRGEEAELWRWLEERVGDKAWMGHQPASGPAKGAARVFDGLDLMGEQEVSEAIRVTKEKLGVLEDALRARDINKAQSTESNEQKTSPPVAQKVEL